MTSRREALLAEFWARCEAGEALTPAAFAREHADDAGWLLPALDNLLATAALLPSGELPGTIGGYRVEGRLGRGATGEVLAVVDGGGRKLALKRLQPLVAAGERANQRLSREAAVLRELRHPHIVEVVDFAAGDGDEAAFLVMARVDGRPLSALVDEARREGRERAFATLPGSGSSWQRIAGLVATLADAVEAAHAAGVLHRDLKPGNVLLRADGAPVIVDFGLAADARAATLTATGDVLGTPQYMAPEQARGEAATEASDVYGLGAVLYELATLMPPHGGGDALQVLDAARRRPPLPPRARCPDVPRELDLIVRRATAFRPAHRFATAAALAAALRHVAAGGRPIGLTLGLALRVDEFWRRRRRSLAAGVALLATAGVALVGLDLRATARAERLRSARIAAVECHLDGDTRGAAEHARVLADLGERALADWLVSGGPGGDDPFVRQLAAGHAAIGTDAAAAVQTLQAAVALRPDASVAVAWLGLAALRARRLETAERELASAVRALPGSVRLRIEFGFLLSARGKYAESAAQLQRAVELPRADANTWHELAKRHSQNQHFDAALAAIDRAIAMSEQRDVAMLRTKAAVLDGMKRHEEAAALFERVVAEMPTRTTWTSYGRALDSLHRLEEAAAAYRQALALDPRHAPALLSLVYLHSGSNPECEHCRAYFVAHPGLIDPTLADRHATAMLVAQEGSYEHAEVVAGYLRRVGGGPTFAAALAERLQRDLPPAALGRLLRAQRALRGE